MFSNPYSGADFFSFFGVFFYRMWSFLTGKIGFEGLVSDEIQIFVLASVAISGALVGTFLVLRKTTMLANALSHTILLGIVAVYLFSFLVLGRHDFYQSFSIPLLTGAALIAGFLTTFFIQFLNQTLKLQEDASIGIVFTLLFALGVILVTVFSRNTHISIELVMGNADALTLKDFPFVATVMIFNCFLILVLFNGFKITTFDPVLAKTYGFSPSLFSYLLMVQTSITTISAFRAVGVLMILAFLVIPPITARLLTNRLKFMILWAVVVGVSGSIIGVALSRHILTFFGIGLSTGGMIVTVLGTFFLLVTLYRQKIACRL